MPPRTGRPPTRRQRPLTLGTAIGIGSLVLPTMTILRHPKPLVLGSLLLLNVATFLTFGYDKMQARNLEWRVSEATLFTLSLLGGWPGAMVGMHYFQHKTRKTRFLTVFWLIVVGWEVLSWNMLVF